MSTTTERITLNTGMVLPNGWTVVDFWYGAPTEEFNRDQGYLLAMVPHHHDRFATWSFTVLPTTDGMQLFTRSGHYHSGIFAAAKDFARRIGQGES